MSWSIDIISCITDRFVELTATEKRIAQFILDDVAAAAELPIAEIARLTQTSQASVTRFARALGCKDVRELKMKLAQSLAVGQRFILDVPDLEGVQGIYESIISVLETNRRALDIEALKRAVSWLSEARQILALGMGGGSTICAQEIQYRLFRLGLPVVSQSDGLLVRMMSSAVTPRCWRWSMCWPPNWRWPTKRRQKANYGVLSWPSTATAAASIASLLATSHRQRR